MNWKYLGTYNLIFYWMIIRGLTVSRVTGSLSFYLNEKVGG